MSTTSQVYLDLVGEVERAWPRSYDECIMRDCPACGANQLELCINPLHGKPRKTPCVRRLTQPWN